MNIARKTRSKWTRFRRVAAILLAVGTVGCQTVMPPSLPPTRPRRPIRPRSYKMKLAVFNFVDQTGSAGKLVQTIPDVLSTELFNTGRFELKERAELRAIQAGKIEEIREKYKFEVDAFLVGSITKFSVNDKTMTLDVRAINAFNGTVMYAGNHSIHYKGVLDVEIEREDVSKVSNEIYVAFPKLDAPNLKVASLSGKMATINVGEADGAKVGMGILLLAHGDSLKDPETGEELGDEIYVGEAYIVEVSEKSCKAILVSTRPEDTATFVKLGDGIRFK